MKKRPGAKRGSTKRVQAAVETTAADARSVRELAAALNRPSDALPIEASAASPAPVVAPTLPLRDRVRGGAGITELLLFRVGGELFAADLVAVEEALEIEDMRVLCEMPPAMLGLIKVRGRMAPLYSPARALGVPARDAGAALVLRVAARRIGLAVDDVDDVLRVDLSAVVEAPAREDEIVIGMTRRGRDLVAIIDIAALLAACITAQALEIG